MKREGLHLFSGVVLVVLVVPETVSGLARFSTTLLVALAVGDAVVGGPFVETQAYFVERMPLAMVDHVGGCRSRYV